MIYLSSCSFSSSSKLSLFFYVNLRIFFFLKKGSLCYLYIPLYFQFILLGIGQEIKTHWGIIVEIFKKLHWISWHMHPIIYMVLVKAFIIRLFEKPLPLFLFLCELEIIIISLLTVLSLFPYIGKERPGRRGSNCCQFFRSCGL